MTHQQPNPTRRGFLDWILALCSGITGAAMGIPGIMYLWPAARGGSGENVEVLGATGLGVGQSTMLQVAGKAVIVVRDRNGYKAFSAVCTHLGCLVRWDTAKKVFLCPCHAAIFDDRGQVVSGPPPSALSKYAVTEIGEKVYVSAA